MDKIKAPYEAPKVQPKIVEPESKESEIIKKKENSVA